MIQYNKTIKLIPNVLWKHWDPVAKDNRLAQIWDRPPVVALKDRPT